IFADKINKLISLADFHGFLTLKIRENLRIMRSIICENPCAKKKIIIYIRNKLIINYLKLYIEWNEIKKITFCVLFMSLKT
ncbi:MAG: hypothetical protein RLZZ292_806, partial [Bacteroidota bacterium]